MKFFHLSDLHLGKIIHGVSMIDQGDQLVWVDRFLELCGEVKPDAVVIAGDIYDRSSPSSDAVQLFNRLLTGLESLKIMVAIVSGNHDSGGKLAFASEILSKQNVHIAGLIERKIPSVRLEDVDGHGPITFWLMPYIFPSLIGQKLEDESIRDYDTAVRRLLEEQDINFDERNVMVAHQNVTASGQEAIRGGSESMVGGVGQIDYTAFDGFDYVALGHIHAAYSVGRPEVRYAGSPLCYHFNETKQAKKGPVLVELDSKGEAVKAETFVIEPLHPMREIRGDWEDIQKEMESNSAKGEYLKVVLQDQRVTPKIASYLRSMAEGKDSLIMELLSDYREYSAVEVNRGGDAISNQPVEELFVDYYGERKPGDGPSEEEVAILHMAGELTRKAMNGGKSGLDESDVDKLLAFVLGQEG